MATQPSKRSKGRLIGYARVSTYDQELNLQRDALRKHGCQQGRILGFFAQRSPKRYIYIQASSRLSY